MTREYPPEVYGGAGVHVTELVAQLRRLCEVDVHCMGAPRPGAFAYQPDPRLQDANAALSTLSADLVMANAASAATVVHSHTWYAGLAGHLAAMLYDIPHVLTAHSLEPLRPWKAEQLGGGYRVSSWVEHTAVLARRCHHRGQLRDARGRAAGLPRAGSERVHVIRNGVDTDVWYPAGPGPTGSVLAELGVDPSRPIVAFVGRITRQKGVAHLLAAATTSAPRRSWCCAPARPILRRSPTRYGPRWPGWPADRTGVFWVREMLPIEKLREILSAATVFVCPSVYEPLGIVNLEAMACATAVVASDVGGIPEVVADGITGSLVHYDAADPNGYRARLAEAVNELIADPDKSRALRRAGRQRCIEEFSWAQVAEQTLDIYRKVCA